MMHTLKYEKSVLFILHFNVVGRFLLIHCHISTNSISFFCTCEVWHTLLWGVTYSFIFVPQPNGIFDYKSQNTTLSFVRDTLELLINFAASLSSHYCHLQYSASPKYSWQKFRVRKITARFYPPTLNLSWPPVPFINCQWCLVLCIVTELTDSHCQQMHLWFEQGLARREWISRRERAPPWIGFFLQDILINHSCLALRVC